MRQLLIAVSMVLFAGFGALDASAEPQRETMTQHSSVPASDYTELFVNGYTFSVPIGLPANMANNETIVRNTDGSFGLSIKFVKNAQATPSGAYELCSNAISNLGIEHATLNKVNINGIEGACVQGTMEGLNVAIEILDIGKKYLQATCFFTEAHTRDAMVALTSVKKE